MWIKLRVSDAERVRWLAKAADAGVTLSALIRQGLDGLPNRRPRRRTETDPALLRELARIGNNLNQVARWANRNKAGAEARGVLMALIEIDRELSVLRQSLEPGKRQNSSRSGVGFQEGGKGEDLPDERSLDPGERAAPC